MEAIVRPILSVIHGRLVPVYVYVCGDMCAVAARARITGSRRILCARRGTSRHLRYRAYIVRRDEIVSLRLR